MNAKLSLLLLLISLVLNLRELRFLPFSDYDGVSIKRFSLALV